MIKIYQVKTKKDLLTFIKLPFKLYKNNPNWVPPLIMDQKNFFNPKKNPYFDRHEYWTKDHWDEIFDKEFPTYNRGFIGAVEEDL